MYNELIKHLKITEVNKLRILYYIHVWVYLSHL